VIQDDLGLEACRLAGLSLEPEVAVGAVGFEWWIDAPSNRLRFCTVEIM
jgi:hypothetical protein